MKKILFILLLPISISTLAQRWQDTAKAIETLFTRYQSQYPGCELAISRNGHLLFSKAWGSADLEHPAPMTTTSIIEAGSISKQFTAAAILLLQQQNKLSLDDDVRKYIPELPDYGKPILLRYLMHHTSGLRDWGAIAAIAGWPRTTKTYNNKDALDIIIHQKALNAAPNEIFGYSNSNYTLLAIIVERISRMSLPDFTRKYIFIPAGMTHTSWRDDHKRIVPDRAMSYALNKNGTYETNMPNEDTYGHGALLTTAEDLLKWNEYYLNGHLGDLKTQIKIDSLNNGMPNPYAAGLFIAQKHEQLYITHDGATASYRARLSSYPTMHLSIAWLSNTSAFDTADNIALKVEDLFFPPMAQSKPSRHAVETHQYPVSDSTLQTYTGKYYSEEAQAGFTVQLRQGKLYLYRAPQTLILLVPRSKDHFNTVHPDFNGDNGEIYFENNKRMLISISRASNVIFDKLPTE